MEFSTSGKPDGLEIASVGVLHRGSWDKKYWSCSRGKDRYPYPIGYHAVRIHGGDRYKMEINEGPKGPLFVVSSDDGNSGTGETPDIAWENFQKKCSTRVKMWHGKRFSCKIDGVQLFGFRNPLVQRLLRELVASANGVAEQSSVSPCSPSNSSKLEVHSKTSHSCPDLVVSTRKHQSTGKRSSKNRSTTKIANGVVPVKKHRSEVVTPSGNGYMSNDNVNVDEKATASTEERQSCLDERKDEESHQTNWEYCDVTSMDEDCRQKGTSDPKLQMWIPVVERERNLEPVVESLCHPSDDSLAKELNPCPASLKEHSWKFDGSRDTVDGSDSLPETYDVGVVELNSISAYVPDTLDYQQDNVADSALETHKCKLGTEGVVGLQLLVTPEPNDSCVFYKNLSKEGTNEDDVNRNCSSSESLELDPLISVTKKISSPVKVVVSSEKLKAELNSGEENGTFSSTPNTSSEKSDFDSAGQELEKSMMMVLLPQVLPLLQKYSRKKKVNTWKRNTSSIKSGIHVNKDGLKFLLEANGNSRPSDIECEGDFVTGLSIKENETQNKDVRTHMEMDLPSKGFEVDVPSNGCKNMMSLDNNKMVTEGKQSSEYESVVAGSFEDENCLKGKKGMKASHLDFDGPSDQSPIIATASDLNNLKLHDDVSEESEVPKRNAENPINSEPSYGGMDAPLNEYLEPPNNSPKCLSAPSVVLPVVHFLSGREAKGACFADGKDSQQPFSASVISMDMDLMILPGCERGMPSKESALCKDNNIQNTQICDIQNEEIPEKNQSDKPLEKSSCKIKESLGLCPLMDTDARDMKPVIEITENMQEGDSTVHASPVGKFQIVNVLCNQAQPGIQRPSSIVKDTASCELKFANNGVQVPFMPLDDRKINSGTAASLPSHQVPQNVADSVEEISSLPLAGELLCASTNFDSGEINDIIHDGGSFKKLSAINASVSGEINQSGVADRGVCNESSGVSELYLHDQPCLKDLKSVCDSYDLLCAVPTMESEDQTLVASAAKEILSSCSIDTYLQVGKEAHGLFGHNHNFCNFSGRIDGLSHLQDQKIQCFHDYEALAASTISEKSRPTKFVGADAGTLGWKGQLVSTDLEREKSFLPCSKPCDKSNPFIELIGCYEHPNPVLSLFMSTQGDIVYICVICGLVERRERSIFVYEVLVREMNQSCPSFLGYTMISLPSQGEPFDIKIATERSWIQLTPDGQALVLLDTIQAPACREQDLNCLCSMCSSICEPNAVKIVAVKLGYVSALTKVKTMEIAYCILVCAPSFLVASGASGRLHVLLMNSSWSTIAEEFVLPSSNQTPASIIELRKIPQCSYLVIGHNSHGGFGFWDISRRVLLGRFSGFECSVDHVLPIGLFSRQKRDPMITGLMEDELRDEAIMATEDWISGGYSVSNLEGNEIAVWLLISTASHPGEQLSQLPEDSDGNHFGCWRLALLVNNAVVMGTILNPRAKAAAILAGYGIIGTHEGLVYMWELSSGRKVANLHSFDGGVSSIVADTSSSILAVVGDECNVLLYVKASGLHLK
ncbi:uncharacterized protein LOC18446213 isoform X2 [Amborella trichopoda]|uniref:FYR C-terminal domain-containing protein n=1 Tax=Amborella trichopoda TaxID=13333 RepID=U5D5Z1_AMBTC|nr:uncharacterized protein LOC18446213 isoform X2 [Amborella trichopoda]ERN17864.1 hypothetical protein AMTR_s00047p00207890 [Amborella trichopoda]|eukprot:XP_020530464.1 uncharacterized protein LOC18446213 isoform X2 [Amborella trichopoda]